MIPIQIDCKSNQRHYNWAVILKLQYANYPKAGFNRYSSTISYPLITSSSSSSSSSSSFFPFFPFFSFFFRDLLISFSPCRQAALLAAPESRGLVLEKFYLTAFHWKLIAVFIVKIFVGLIWFLFDSFKFCLWCFRWVHRIGQFGVGFGRSHKSGLWSGIRISRGTASAKGTVGQWCWCDTDPKHFQSSKRVSTTRFVHRLVGWSVGWSHFTFCITFIPLSYF